MKIKINKSEEFVVIPSIFKEEENPPKFVFKTPTSEDILTFLFTNNVHELLYSCFKEFENKIELEDGNGKPIEYKNYKDFVNVGSSPEIIAIHTECVIEMTNRVNAMQEKAVKTEKKSK